MMRFSVGVKSRPSTRVWNRPSPPNRLSTTMKHQVGSNMNSAVPRSGFDLHQVEIGGHDQVAHELAVLEHAHRAHRDFGALAHEVEQPDAQQAREALVDRSRAWACARGRCAPACRCRTARTPSASSAGACSSASPVTPRSSASTSSWDRMSSATISKLPYGMVPVAHCDAVASRACCAHASPGPGRRLRVIESRTKSAAPRPRPLRHRPCALRPCSVALCRLGGVRFADRIGLRRIRLGGRGIDAQRLVDRLTDLGAQLVLLLDRCSTSSTVLLDSSSSTPLRISGRCTLI